MNSIFKFDMERLNTIGRIIQNSFLYLIFIFILGLILEDIFPKKDIKKEKNIIILEIIGQFLLLCIGIFYINKIINVIPYIGKSNYETDDISIMYIEISIITSIILLLQNNFIDKIKFLLDKKEYSYKENMINKNEYSYSTDISHLPY